MPEGRRAWRAAARVADALCSLEELARKRAEVRQVPEQADEEIDVAVAHLRVDGASWAQIGRALGPAWQGARQRFRGVSGVR